MSATISGEHFENNDYSAVDSIYARGQTEPDVCVLTVACLIYDLKLNEARSYLLSFGYGEEKINDIIILAFRHLTSKPISES